MNKNFKKIIMLLTTQAMINLGEITDPVLQKKNINMKNASLFINLIKVLKEKTEGNLSADESKFLGEVLENLEKIFKSKKSIGSEA